MSHSPINGNLFVDETFHGLNGSKLSIRVFNFLYKHIYRIHIELNNPRQTYSHVILGRDEMHDTLPKLKRILTSPSWSNLVVLHIDAYDRISAKYADNSGLIENALTDLPQAKYLLLQWRQYVKDQADKPFFLIVVDSYGQQISLIFTSRQWSVVRTSLLAFISTIDDCMYIQTTAVTAPAVQHNEQTCTENDPQSP